MLSVGGLDLLDVLLALLPAILLLLLLVLIHEVLPPKLIRSLLLHLHPHSENSDSFLKMHFCKCSENYNLSKNAQRVRWLLRFLNCLSFLLVLLN